MNDMLEPLEDPFSELVKGLTNNGLSFVSLFVGDNTLDGFAKDLRRAGGSICSYRTRGR